MAIRTVVDEARELRELDEDEKRIDAALNAIDSPEIRAQLMSERRWIERRRHALVRQPVSCVALLDAGSVPVAVRVRDVSPAGAGLELDRPPPVGTRVRISFPALPGTPALEAIVRHGSAATRHAGVEFVGAGERLAAIVAELARSFPR